MKCKYGREKEVKYFDSAENDWVQFKCDVDSKEDGYCIFHHPTYWERNKDEVKNEFMKKVENAIKNQEKLICIGYNLPEIHLYKKEFKADVYFENTIFHEGVDFRNTRFFKEANFNYTKFHNEVHFENAEFFKEATFIDTEFLKKVSFLSTKFFEKANFKNAIFHEEADFQKAEFSEGAIFIDVNFFKAAYFSGTIFREAYFVRVIFHGVASFNNTIFHEGVDFRNTRFFKEANFNNAEFFGRTLFDYAEFLDNVSFDKTKFSPDLLEKCLDPINIISFRRVLFKKQQNVTFDGTNMSRVSFLHTNIDRVNFRNIKWESSYDGTLLLLKYLNKERKKFIEKGLEKATNELKDLEKNIHDKNKRIKELEATSIISKKLEELKKIIEEEKIKKEKLEKTIQDYINNKKERINEVKNKIEGYFGDDLTLDNVLSVYRSLRENYDYYLKYEESGKLFVEEMKLKRKLIGKEEGSKSFVSKISNEIEKFTMWIYEILSLYGESYVRSIIWSIIVIVFFSFIRPLILQNFCLNFIFEQMRKSLLIFFQLYWDSKILTIIERLLSIPILGSLFIALKRKLERRIRH